MAAGQQQTPIAIGIFDGRASMFTKIVRLECPIYHHRHLNNALPLQTVTSILVLSYSPHQRCMKPD